jgi:hypothetical protein
VEVDLLLGGGSGLAVGRAFGDCFSGEAGLGNLACRLFDNLDAELGAAESA